jgi:hypothetical protein
MRAQWEKVRRVFDTLTLPPASTLRLRTLRSSSKAIEIPKFRESNVSTIDSICENARLDLMQTHINKWPTG